MYGDNSKHLNIIINKLAIQLSMFEVGMKDVINKHIGNIDIVTK